MARLWQSGAEENSTTLEGTTVVGSPTIDSTIKRTGSYSFKTAAAGSATSFRYQFKTSNTSAAFYFRLYLYISSLPGSQDIIIRSDRTQNDGVIGIRLETSGALSLYNEALGTQVKIGSSSSALSTGQWYCIEFKVDNTTQASTVVDARIDGVSFASGTVDTSLHGGQAILQFGSISGRTATYYFDDIAINDTSGSNQNAYPIGAGQIVHLRPNAAGDNTQWTIGGSSPAATNWQGVSEVTPDDATSYNADVLLNDTDDFNIDDTPSSIGASDTINVVAIGVRFNAAVAAAEASFKTRVKKASGGTISEGSQLTPGSTAWKTNMVVTPPANYSHVTYQDPDASAWTKSTLDSAQIGYRISVTNTNAAQITAVWMSVDSTPVSTVTTTKTQTGLARIIATTLRTITGLARIQESTNQAITGVARIQKIISQTITGLARVTTTTLKTITGVARITVSTTRIVTGLARIQETVNQTITGKARIQELVNRTITGLARVTASALKTITGKARIQESTSQTVTGKSRIQEIVNQTITGLASIASSLITTTKTITGTARVTTSTIQTIAGKTRIIATTLQVVTGKATMQEATTRTIIGLARIQEIVNQTITGKARIVTLMTKDILGLARIQETTTQTVTGVAQIQEVVLQTITGKANIPSAINQTIIGQSRVTATTQKIIRGKASILSNVPPAQPRIIFVDDLVAYHLFGPFYTII